VLSAQVIAKIADSNEPGGRDAAPTNGVFNHEVVADEADVGKPLLRLKSDRPKRPREVADHAK
jgi:hypothetical protein